MEKAERERGERERETGRKIIHRFREEADHQSIKIVLAASYASRESK